MPSPLQPGVVGLQSLDMLQHLNGLHPSFQGLTGAMQVQVAVHVGAAAQAARLDAELDLFITEDAQVSQHELGPVLIEIAEEHQSQALAQCHDLQAVESISQLRTPLGERTCLVLEVCAKDGQQFAFSGLGLPDKGLERLHDLGFLQYREQSLQLQRSVVPDPAQGQQGHHRRFAVADFAIVQLAGAKVLALAHHQAHQQSPRNFGQG